MFGNIKDDWLKKKLIESHINDIENEDHDGTSDRDDKNVSFYMTKVLRLIKEAMEANPSDKTRTSDIIEVRTYDILRIIYPVVRHGDPEYFKDFMKLASEISKNLASPKAPKSYVTPDDLIRSLLSGAWIELVTSTIQRDYETAIKKAILFYLISENDKHVHTVIKEMDTRLKDNKDINYAKRCLETNKQVSSKVDVKKYNFEEYMNIRTGLMMNINKYEKELNNAIIKAVGPGKMLKLCQAYYSSLISDYRLIKGDVVPIEPQRR